MRRAALLAALAALLAGGPAGSAHAAFGIAPGSAELEVLDAAGEPDARAGGHPDRLRLAFALNTLPGGGVDGNLKDIAIDLPPGLSGDPSAVTACSREAFDLGFVGGGACPPEATVGEGRVFVHGIGELSAPIFNLAPAPEQLAALGMNPIFKFPLAMRLRRSDFGVTIELADIPQPLAVEKMGIELWGVPADHQGGTSAPRRPFLSLPTRCGGEPLAIDLRVRSWQEPGAWRTARAATAAPLSGCGELSFEPRLSAALTEPAADSPTGAEVTVELPRSADPDGRAGSQLRSVRVALPAGLSIAPAGAWGVVEGTRLGSIELTGSALPAPLTGSIVAGGELPGRRLGFRLVARGHGVDVELPGSLGVDRGTGRLSAELTDLPQVPLERIVLRFDGGAGALLATPADCGPVTVEASLDPYSGGPAVRSTDAVAIGPHPAAGSCGPSVFAPSFEAGSTSARAGRPTGFSVLLRRRDGEAGLGRFAVSLPAGLSASLGAVEVCAAADAARGACPAASRIGAARAELGPGTPVPLGGDVFLTGPHRDAPFGLAVAFRAALGPFDLGQIVVRAALRIDPRSGRVEIDTDPLPQQIEGVPVRLGGVALRLDRRGFLRNPTSCEPATVAAAIASTAAAVARPASRFSLRGCDALGFRPRPSLALTEPHELRRRGHPGLRLALRAHPGDANLRGATFQLPRSLSLDPAALAALCSRRAAGNGNCPRGSAVGRATARTPLLGQPLRGPVYAVQPHGEGLPDLWAALRGGGIRLDVRGKTLLREGRAHAQLVDVPDLPMSAFALRLDGGEGGVLELSGNPCRAGTRGEDSTVDLEGHNGAYRIVPVPLSLAACGARRVG